jgi:hypothetical protein
MKSFRLIEEDLAPPQKAGITGRDLRIFTLIFVVSIASAWIITTVGWKIFRFVLTLSDLRGSL